MDNQDNQSGCIVGHHTYNAIELQLRAAICIFTKPKISLHEAIFNTCVVKLCLSED